MGFKRDNVIGSITHTNGIVVFPDKITVGTTSLLGDETLRVDGYVTVGGALVDTFIEMTDGQLVDVSNPNEGRIRYNASTQHWEISSNGGAYQVIDTSAGEWTRVGDTLEPSTASVNTWQFDETAFGEPYIKIEPTSSAPGKALTVIAQNTSAGSSAAGDLRLYGGESANSGPGGNTTLKGGTAANGTGGYARVEGGRGATGDGGDIIIIPGSGSVSNGEIQIKDANSIDQIVIGNDLVNFTGLSVIADGNPTWEFGSGNATFEGNVLVESDLEVEGKLVIDGYYDMAPARSLVAIGQTTDTTPTELLVNLADRVVIQDNSNCSFSLLVSARRVDSNGENATFMFEGNIHRDSGVGTTVLDDYQKTIVHTDDADWDVDISADVVNGALKIEVVGENAKVIIWAARIDTMEIVY